jgi:hypothetical protein
LPNYADDCHGWMSFADRQAGRRASSVSLLGRDADRMRVVVREADVVGLAPTPC